MKGTEKQLSYVTYLVDMIQAHIDEAIAGTLERQPANEAKVVRTLQELSDQIELDRQTGSAGKLIEELANMSTDPIQAVKEVLLGRVREGRITL